MFIMVNNNNVYILLLVMVNINVYDMVNDGS